MKKQMSLYLPKQLIDKLNDFCSKHNKIRNGEIETAIENYLTAMFDEVDVSLMTYQEAKAKWIAVNSRIHILKQLEKELYNRLEKEDE